MGKLACPPSFYFCDNRQDADACATLVVKGIKQATAPSLWWFDKHKENRPEVGDYHIITKWDGTPVAVIQTTAVVVIPFGQVDAGFAHAEGEGDRRWYNGKRFIAPTMLVRWTVKQTRSLTILLWFAIVFKLFFVH
ncbi:MAG: hypothetical protein CM15mP83_7130 [Flavobacteriaceae bacterium]|nr:MAG: hypothetical protein CM15mP83_7130 [Flavobacteriaceae bacterium]